LNVTICDFIERDGFHSPPNIAHTHPAIRFVLIDAVPDSVPCDAHVRCVIPVDSILRFAYDNVREYKRTDANRGQADGKSVGVRNFLVKGVQLFVLKLKLFNQAVFSGKIRGRRDFGRGQGRCHFGCRFGHVP
jgi:hypothetical protein